jgi:hypothetical protein
MKSIRDDFAVLLLTRRGSEEVVDEGGRISLDGSASPAPFAGPSRKKIKCGQAERNCALAADFEIHAPVQCTTHHWRYRHDDLG